MHRGSVAGRWRRSAELPSPRNSRQSIPETFEGNESESFGTGVVTPGKSPNVPAWAAKRCNNSNF